MLKSGSMLSYSDRLYQNLSSCNRNVLGSPKYHAQSGGLGLAELLSSNFDRELEIDLCSSTLNELVKSFHQFGRNSFLQLNYLQSSSKGCCMELRIFFGNGFTVKTCT